MKQIQVLLLVLCVLGIPAGASSGFHEILTGSNGTGRQDDRLKRLIYLSYTNIFQYKQRAPVKRLSFNPCAVRYRPDLSHAL